MKGLAKKKVIVKGEKVQDDEFKFFLFEVAESIGLRGFHVKDVKDYLESLIEGNDDKVSEFLNFVKTDHPEQVKVKEVIVEDYDGIVMQIDRFNRYFNAYLLAKIVSIGESMLECWDRHLKTGGERSEHPDGRG